MKHSVYTGLDNIEALGLAKGARVGLITNTGACRRDGKQAIDVISEKYTLCALFAPEHGLEARLEAGKSFENSMLGETKVYSLYGANSSPDHFAAASLDALIYDIQDVGARHYTYLSTLSNSMRICAETGTAFIVLDRPNPLGGVIDGEVLEERFSSFVGMYPIPTRYGLTIGEYARYINSRYNINCHLKICEMSGWNRDLIWRDTDLVWRAPSPNIPNCETCFYYLSTCFLEATNLSEGRGTPYPFRIFAAPDLNSNLIAHDLNSRNLPGISFSPIHITPTASKWMNTECNAVLLTITDFNKFNALSVKLNVFSALRKHYPSLSVDRDFFCKLTGNSLLLDDDLPIYKLQELFDLQAQEFKKLCAFSHIYN